MQELNNACDQLDDVLRRNNVDGGESCAAQISNDVVGKNGVNEPSKKKRRFRRRNNLNALERDALAACGCDDEGRSINNSMQATAAATLSSLSEAEVVRRAAVVERASVLLQCYHKLRARRAGLMLRAEQSSAAFVADESMGGYKSNVEQKQGSAKTKDAATAVLTAGNVALKSTVTDLERRLNKAEKVEETLQQDALTLRRRLREMDEHLSDLQAAHSVGSWTGLSDISEERDASEQETSKKCASRQGGSSEQISSAVDKQNNASEDVFALENARDRLRVAEARCVAFESQASEFEQEKSQACIASDKLQDLSGQVRDARESELEPLQHEVASKQAALRSLRAAVKRVLAKTLAGGTDACPKDKFGFAAALDILLQNGGEMALSEWKSAIASAPPSPSSANVIQTVYGLVANSLVTIDRAQAEPRVLSLVVP